jgi:hypothetical protein
VVVYDPHARIFADDIADFFGIVDIAVVLAGALAKGAGQNIGN